jgi:hypothetical protein
MQVSFKRIECVCIRMEEEDQTQADEDLTL